MSNHYQDEITNSPQSPALSASITILKKPTQTIKDTNTPLKTSNSCKFISF